MKFVKFALAAGVLLCLQIQPADAKRITFVSTSNGGNCNECEFIVADGDIAIDSVDDFREVGGARVLINSKGGSLEGAIALGEEFRRRGVDVSVYKAEQRAGSSFYDEKPSGECLSACVYAFFGGVKREVRDGSTLGIHAFAGDIAETNVDAPVYTRLELTAVQRLTGVLLEYTQRMGIDPLVIDWAAKQDNSGMRILTGDEMRLLRIVWDPIRALPLRLEPYKNGVLARTETADTSGKVTLVCVGRDLRLVFSSDLPPPTSGLGRIDGIGNRDSDTMTLDLKADEDDFGNWVDATYKFSQHGNVGFATIKVDKTLLADLVKAKFINISIGDTRGALENALITFPTQNLEQIASLIKRNCV
jgi:hypothetical protein